MNRNKKYDLNNILGRFSRKLLKIYSNLSCRIGKSPYDSWILRERGFATNFPVKSVMRWERSGENKNKNKKENRRNRRAEEATDKLAAALLLGFLFLLHINKEDE